MHYQYGAAYGAHKAGLDKFAADMAVDFRPFGVAAVSIWMGAVLTERLRQIIDSGPELAYLDDIAETPEFTGHVIAALAADPDVLAVSGRTLIGAELARQYGISDRDGRHPPSVRDLMSVEPVNYQGRIRPMTDDQLQQLMRDVQYLKDRQAILDVIMRHARGHDRHDTELMNSCFWDDGVDEHGQFVTPGPEYGDWANKTHTAGYFLHMHNITNHTCEIDGDTAHCESYVIGAMLPRSAPGRAKFVSGRYLDRLERRDGEWRILVRRTTIEVEVEGDVEVAGERDQRDLPQGRVGHRGPVLRAPAAARLAVSALGRQGPLRLARPAPSPSGPAHGRDDLRQVDGGADARRRGAHVRDRVDGAVGRVAGGHLGHLLDREREADVDVQRGVALDQDVPAVLADGPGRVEHIASSTRWR